MVLDAVGVDPSPGMVNVFKRKLDQPGFPVNMSCALGDITAVATDPLGDARFDVVVSSMTFHHVPDVENMMQAIVRHLKPSGTAAVLDLLKTEHSHAFHAKGGGHGVHHGGGFSEDDMRAVFEGAGFTDFAFKVAFEFEKEVDGGEKKLPFKVFLATGRLSSNPSE